MINRDNPDWTHYRPSRAGKRGVLALLTPDEYAALREWAKDHGAAISTIGADALREWMDSHGVTPQEPEGARRA